MVSYPSLSSGISRLINLIDKYIKEQKTKKDPYLFMYMYMYMSKYLADSGILTTSRKEAKQTSWVTLVKDNYLSTIYRVLCRIYI